MSKPQPLAPPKDSVIFKIKCPSCPESMLVRITKKQLKELLKGMKLSPEQANLYYQRNVGSLAVVKEPKPMMPPQPPPNAIKVERVPEVKQVE